MATYVLLIRMASDIVKDPEDFPKEAAKVSKKLREGCPGIKWKDSYALMGRYDILDIVEADDPNEVAKAAMIIRANGHSSTEILLATPWTEFLAAF